MNAKISLRNGISNEGGPQLWAVLYELENRQKAPDGFASPHKIKGQTKIASLGISPIFVKTNLQLRSPIKQTQEC